MDLTREQFYALVDAYTTLLVYGRALQPTHPQLAPRMIEKAKGLTEQFPDLKYAIIVKGEEDI